MEYLVRLTVINHETNYHAFVNALQKMKFIYEKCNCPFSLDLAVSFFER